MSYRAEIQQITQLLIRPDSGNPLLRVHPYDPFLNLQNTNIIPLNLRAWCVLKLNATSTAYANDIGEHPQLDICQTSPSPVF